MFDSAIIKLEDAIWGIDKYFQSNAQQIFGEDFIVDFAGLSGIELNHDSVIYGDKERVYAEGSMEIEINVDLPTDYADDYDKEYALAYFQKMLTPLINKNAKCEGGKDLVFSPWHPNGLDLGINHTTDYRHTQS